MARKEVKRRATKTGLKQKEFSRQFNDDNIVSIVGSQKRKSWSVQDIKTIKPLTDNQGAMIESYFQGNHIVADGSAGTGKTFLALWLALNSVLSKDFQQDHVIIVRSAVASRDIGFLPGTAEEKLEPYEVPYKDILTDLFGRASTYDDMKEAGKIKFMPTSFVRGLTWDNAVVVIDEMQNLTLSEINSIVTRLGVNSRLVVCGDYNQNDLTSKRYDATGIKEFLKIAKNMKDFDIISFNKYDIVRSDFVKSWICAKEDLGL